MQYKTKYREAYDRGTRNLSLTISAKAADLLLDNDIENTSAFINDLIIEGLVGPENYFVRQKIGRFNELQKELEPLGYEVTLFKKKSEV